MKKFAALTGFTPSSAQSTLGMLLKRIKDTDLAAPETGKKKGSGRKRKAGMCRFCYCLGRMWVLSLTRFTLAADDGSDDVADEATSSKTKKRKRKRRMARLRTRVRARMAVTTPWSRTRFRTNAPMSLLRGEIEAPMD